jgi:predicted alpha/beta-hydrolase family hydrolase
MVETERKFVATPGKGEVSVLLVRPEGATHLLVLGHGASTTMRHATLKSIAEALADADIATFRYNIPYAEHGKGRDTQRAEHLASVTVPMLFLSGTRDDLAAMELLRPVCEGLGRRATLHAVETADHGYKVLKRSRASDEDVFAEMARVVRGWASGLAR